MDGQKNGQKRRNGRKNGQTNRRNFTNFERNLAMMVIYLPVKFEFDWSNRFKVRVRKRKCGQTDGWTDKWTKNGQTNTRNFTNFERNLAMMVIYLPVKFEFDWSNRFKVRVRKRKCGQTDGWTDKRTKNGQTNIRNFTNFERNLAMMVIYLPVKFEFDWSNRFKVRVRKRKMWTDRRTDRRTDGQTDVGHINLIGGLVTRNPPKNILIYSQMIFHLDERHCLKATVLEGGKKSINWVSVGNFETSSRPNR